MRSIRSVGGNPITVYALNDWGQAVGGGAFPDHPYDAYVWEKGVATELGFLDGDCYSEAFVIGSKGQIAGQSYPCELNSRRPFLWQDGVLVDLNDVIQAPSGFRFTQAFAINDRGEIGGIGTAPGCDDDEDCGHAMMLIPCSGRVNDGDCDQREMLAVRGIASPQQQKTASVCGQGWDVQRASDEDSGEVREESSILHSKAEVGLPNRVLGKNTQPFDGNAKGWGRSEVGPLTQM